MTFTGRPTGRMGTVDTDPLATANRCTAKPSPSGSTVVGITPQTHLFTYQVKHARRPFTNRNLLERVEKTARVAGHEPSQGHWHGIRPQDWIYSGVPTQRDDLRRHEGQGQMDGRLFSPIAFLLHLRKHAVIIASYIQAVSAVHEAFVDAPSALRHARRPAQSHIEGE